MKNPKYDPSKPDSERSRYGRKKKWRAAHCGPRSVLPCYPEVMRLKPEQKPWR
jgi:hypothetical protein